MPEIISVNYQWVPVSNSEPPGVLFQISRSRSMLLLFVAGSLCALPPILLRHPDVTPGYNFNIDVVSLLHSEPSFSTTSLSLQDISTSSGHPTASTAPTPT
jgi:hypothetical protein